MAGFMGVTAWFSQRAPATFLATGLVLLCPDCSAADNSPRMHVADDTGPYTEVTSNSIEAYMKEWEVPGLALAVVRDGHVVHMKGYGYRDLENGLPVTTETQFPIGSITKSFAAAGLGILNDEGRLDWDRPVHEYLPGFRLNDPVATARVTPRDLMSHRTGLPEHDFFMYQTGFTQQQMIDRVRYLELNADLRTTFQYSNLMPMIAGYLAGQLGGSTWEDFTRERILEPLGMENTSLRAKEAHESGDFALGYARRGDGVKHVRNFMLDFEEEGAAGAINSSVEDMSRYLLFLIDRGRLGEKRILSMENAVAMQTPQMPWNRDVPGSLRHEEFGDPFYGLGLVVTTYRGHRLVGHSGGLAGFRAHLNFLPKERSGVVVLTNLSPNPVGNIVVNQVLDQLLGLEPIDWAERARPAQSDSAGTGEGADAAIEDLPAEPPSRRLEDYVGEYEHPGFGTMRIEMREGGLWITNRSLSSALSHLRYEVFEFGPRAQYPNWRVKVVFGSDFNGEIDRLRAALEPAVGDIVFRRRSAER